jgi:hypothetical protein
MDSTSPSQERTATLLSSPSGLYLEMGSFDFPEMRFLGDVFEPTLPPVPARLLNPTDLALLKRETLEMAEWFNQSLVLRLAEIAAREAALAVEKVA